MSYSNFKDAPQNRMQYERERDGKSERLINPLQTSHTTLPHTSTDSARLTEQINSYKCEAEPEADRVLQRRRRRLHCPRAHLLRRRRPWGAQIKCYIQCHFEIISSAGDPKQACSEGGRVGAWQLLVGLQKVGKRSTCPTSAAIEFRQNALTHCQKE